MCTALPKGSKIDCTSRGIAGSCTQTLVIGSDQVLGEGPGPVHADALGVLAEVAPAGQAVAAAPADHVPLAADDVAGVEVLDVARRPRRSGPRTRGRSPAARAPSSATRRPSCRCAGRCRRCPVRRTSISTSLMPISGTGTSSSHRPSSAFLFTSAFMISPSNAANPTATPKGTGPCFRSRTCRPTQRYLAEKWTSPQANMSETDSISRGNRPSICRKQFPVYRNRAPHPSVGTGGRTGKPAPGQHKIGRPDQDRDRKVIGEAHAPLRAGQEKRLPSCGDKPLPAARNGGSAPSSCSAGPWQSSAQC